MYQPYALAQNALRAYAKRFTPWLEIEGFTKSGRADLLRGYELWAILQYLRYK